MPKPWRTISPDLPRTGVLDGLAWALFEPPDAEPVAGVVVLHGADSSKESHYDFCRLLRSHGLAAVSFDQRGHGESRGALGAGAIDDIVAISSLLPDGPIGLRGSSMGGWMAIAAAGPVRAAAVVAICPATTAGLARGLDERRFSFRADFERVSEMLARHDLAADARALGERLLLLHAEGDETVPVEHSRELHAAAPGSRLVVTPGGHHRSIQHDPELQAFSARFLARGLGPV
jgi:pimeloyl-ACP methyl ester carboxylesterase